MMARTKYLYFFTLMDLLDWAGQQEGRLTYLSSLSNIPGGSMEARESEK